MTKQQPRNVRPPCRPQAEYLLQNLSLRRPSFGLKQSLFLAHRPRPRGHSHVSKRQTGSLRPPCRGAQPFQTTSRACRLPPHGSRSVPDDAIQRSETHPHRGPSIPSDPQRFALRNLCVTITAASQREARLFPAAHPVPPRMGCTYWRSGASAGVAEGESSDPSSCS
jgi:hypothetical protein